MKQMGTTIHCVTYSLTVTRIGNITNDDVTDQAKPELEKENLRKIHIFKFILKYTLETCNIVQHAILIN